MGSELSRIECAAVYPIDILAVRGAGQPRTWAPVRAMYTAGCLLFGLAGQDDSPRLQPAAWRVGPPTQSPATVGPHLVLERTKERLARSNKVFLSRLAAR